MMKKMVAMVLALWMLSWTCGALGAEAGETVTVGFSVLEDTGEILLAKLELQYDHEALELVSNQGNDGDIKWYTQGVPLHPAFRIRENAAPGEYPVTLKILETMAPMGETILSPENALVFSEEYVTVERPSVEVPVYYYDAATGELLETETVSLPVGWTGKVTGNAPEGWVITGGQSMQVTVSEDGQAMPPCITLWLAAPVPTAAPSSGSITASTARQAVSDLRVTDRERTAITLMWDSAEYAGPYTVEVRESGTDTWGLWKVAYGTKARLSVKPDTAYDFRVTSVSGPFYGQGAVLSGQKTTAGAFGENFLYIVSGDYTYTLTKDRSAMITGYNGNGGKVSIPADIDGFQVTAIGDNAFNFCSGLTSVTIPDSVTVIGEYAFYCCGGLTSVTIPGSVTVIGDEAFGHCGSLTSVTIQDGVTGIGDQVFYSCDKLTSITIPDSLTEIGNNPWPRCYALTTINISPDHPSLSMIGGALYSKADNRLIWVPSAKEGSFEISRGTRIIGGYALDGCRGVMSVTIPDSVTFIGENAFTFNGLFSLTIPDSVIYIGRGAVAVCDYLTSVTIPAGVKYIGDEAFDGIDNLASFTFEDGETELGDNPWARCHEMTAINVSQNHPTLYLTDGALYSKADKRLVYVPHNAEGHFEIPEGIMSIGGSAFKECESLTSVTIPDGVTTIGQEAFRFCSDLTSVTIPDSVTFIGWGAFLGCPDLVVTVTEGSYAEEYCVSNWLDYRYAEGK